MSRRVILAWGPDPEVGSSGDAFYVVGIHDDDSARLHLDVDIEGDHGTRCAVDNLAMAEYMGLKRATAADIASIFHVTPLDAARFMQEWEDNPDSDNRFFVYDPDKWESIPSAEPRSGRARARITKASASRPDPSEARRERIRTMLGERPMRVRDIADAIGATSRTVERDLAVIGAKSQREGREVTYRVERAD